MLFSNTSSFPSQSPAEFAAKYAQSLIGTPYANTPASTGVFDAVWSLALVLKYTDDMRRLKNQSKGDPVHVNCSSNLTGDLVPLNEFNYSNAFMGCVMKYNFYNINFTGMSVSIYTHVFVWISINSLHTRPLSYNYPEVHVYISVCIYE